MFENMNSYKSENNFALVYLLETFRIIFLYEFWNILSKI